LTQYAEFNYLLTLNEVLLQHCLLIFILKEVDSMHKIRNNKNLLLLTFKGGAMSYWHPPWTRHCPADKSSEIYFGPCR